MSEEIRRLTTQMEQLNSIWRVFLLGIVRGLGSVVGASIVFAVLIYLLSYLIDIFPALHQVLKVIETN